MQYQFISRTTGQAVPLHQIDERVCALVGDRVSHVEYNTWYNALLFFAVGLRLRGEITKDAVQEELDRGGYTPTLGKLARAILVEEFQFDAWR